MCTAVCFSSGGFYFGRTLDHTCSYGEQITVVPRRFPLAFRHLAPMTQHLAFVGMAHVAQGVPLFYDGINEKGLAAAGLLFSGFTRYHPPRADRKNLASFELLSFLLAHCASVKEAESFLENACITEEGFSDRLPPSPLHWLIADRTGSMVVESAADGLRLFHNPVGVLTNAPPFDRQLRHLSSKLPLSPDPPKGLSAPDRSGMGAIELPGGFTSSSRFVRAVFASRHTLPGPDEKTSVRRFFRILDTVTIPPGCHRTPEGELQFTRYASCCSAASGTYYCTGEDRAVSAVSLHRHDLNGDQLFCYPFSDPSFA
ncbi:MAG: choloylglycine hydrolase family protein [Oscillospiraceae bacterium]|nr:choloylglycine hydrolase family protein [Oscillospiraceae bacterium]